MQSISAESAVVSAYAFFGTVATVQASSDQTAGTYSLVELRALKGNQPPLHTHQRDDEGFYVLEGEIRVHVGADTLCLRPGQCAVAPRGIPHTYVVESEQARWLVISNGGFDSFVQELGEPLSDGTPDLEQAAATPPPPMERFLELSTAYDIEVLGPPGTLPS